MKEYQVLTKAKLFIIGALLILLPIMKLTSFTLNELKIIDYPILPITLLWILIPLLTMFYIFDLKQKKWKINHIDIIIYILIILTIISTIFSVDPLKSITGERSRYDGLLTLISYYLLFLNCINLKEEKHKKLLIKIILGIGIFNVIYAFIEVYLPFSIIRVYPPFPYMGMGLCGNPNFLGSLMALLITYVIIMFVRTKEKKYIILTIIYSIGLTLAQSSIPFYVVLILLIVLLIKNKVERKEYAYVLALFLAVSILVNITSIFVQEQILGNIIEDNYNIWKEFILTIKQILGIPTDVTQIQHLGNGRIEIWGNLIPKIKDYWLFGSGPDTIAEIYPNNNLTITDKAHNDYLQILITTGLPCLITYLVLQFNMIIKGKKLTKNIDISLYIAIIIYQIQIFTNISSFEVATNYFVLFGILYSNFTKDKFINKTTK